jgi:hypothetical protein
MRLNVPVIPANGYVCLLSLKFSVVQYNSLYSQKNFNVFSGDESCNRERIAFTVPLSVFLQWKTPPANAMVQLAPKQQPKK